MDATERLLREQAIAHGLDNYAPEPVDPLTPADIEAAAPSPDPAPEVSAPKDPETPDLVAQAAPDSGAAPAPEPPASAAATFERFAPFLKAYSTFCADFASATDRLQGLAELRGREGWDSALEAVMGETDEDSDIVDEMEIHGFHRSYTIEYLIKGEANYATSTYYLMAATKAKFARQAEAKMQAAAEAHEHARGQADFAEDVVLLKLVLIFQFRT